MGFRARRPARKSKLTAAMKAKLFEWASAHKNLDLNFWKSWFMNGVPFVFMQDGPPFYTAKSIKAFLQEKNIPLLPWPGNSPDESDRECVGIGEGRSG